jgi:hypothetical protein
VGKGASAPFPPSLIALRDGGHAVALLTLRSLE